MFRNLLAPGILVNDDAGLTTAGYAVCVFLALAAFLVAGVLAGRRKEAETGREGMSAKQLAFCGVALALGFATSYIKLYDPPYGGSVTLLSMLFICLPGNWYGLAVGLLVAFVYGILQFLQGPYVLSLFQVACDYLLAFTALGLSGLFAGKKNGLSWGYLVGVIARGVFHSLGGYLYWMEYMPEEFPKSLAALYPIIYNYTYLLIEAALTLIIINLPPVKKALEEVRKTAVS